MYIKLMLLTVVSIGELKCLDCKMLCKRSEPGIKSAMEENGVLPDIIDVAPRYIIQVRYPGNVEVSLGNELTPYSVKDEPTIEWPVEKGQFYTFVMIDADVPNRAQPILSAFKHWLVMNIPGKDLTKGETLAPYRGSAPPEGTGLHRYIFLVYKQPGLLKHSETAVDATSNESRMRFKVRQLAEKYNLGQPVAANFFQAQSDDYSKRLWAEWSKQN